MPVLARIHSAAAYKLATVHDAKGAVIDKKLTYEEDFTVVDIGDGVSIVKQRTGGFSKRPLHNYYVRDKGDGSIAARVVLEHCPKNGHCMVWIPSI